MKALGYTALVLFLMAAVFMLSDGMNGITGMAITDLAAAPLGKYEVYPHISTDIGFSIDHYKKLRVDARKLIDLTRQCDMAFLAEQCGGEECAMESCIRAGLETLSLDWQLGCGRGEEGIFYWFAESYTRCSQSADDDCVCEFEISEDHAPGEHKISIVPLEDTTAIESGLMQSIGVDCLARIQDVGGFPGSHKDYGNMDLTFAYGSGLTRSEAVVFSNRFDLKGKVFLHKLGRSLALVFPNDQEIYKEKKACSLPKKTKYIFCAPAEQVTATDASGRAREQSLSYRFALEP